MTVETTVLISTESSNAVLVEETTGVLLETENSAIVTLPEQETVVSSNSTVEYVLTGPSGPIGPPGPPGPPGPAAEEDMIYSKRVDFIDDNLLYRGEAQVGTLENAPLWRIRKVVISPDGDISEIWAGGNANFDKQWANRLTYTYS